MEKTFLNQRDPAFDQKVADLLAQGWTRKEKLQERLNKKNLRKHIRNATVKARLPRNHSLANLERALANVDKTLNANYENTKDYYVPFFRLYNANTTTSKKGKKGNNVVMNNAVNATAVFATPQNVEAMHAYVEANPHLMSNKERSLYEKKKHAIAVDELVALTAKMRAKEGANNSGSAAASAAASPFARVPTSYMSKPLPPSSIVGSLANLQSTKEPNINYSRSKKRLINTRKNPYHSIKVKSLGYALPTTSNMGSSAAAAAAAPAAPAFVPLRLNNGNNGNNNNNHIRNNNNSNNNNNGPSRKKKRQKPNNFRFMNWK